MPAALGGAAYGGGASGVDAVAAGEGARSGEGAVSVGGGAANEASSSPRVEQPGGSSRAENIASPVRLLTWSRGIRSVEGGCTEKNYC